MTLLDENFYFTGDLLHCKGMAANRFIAGAKCAIKAFIPAKIGKWETEIDTFGTMLPPIVPYCMVAILVIAIEEDAAPSTAGLQLRPPWQQQRSRPTAAAAA